MLVKKYCKTMYQWILDRDLLTEQEVSDLRTLRGAQGSYGVGTEVAKAMERLALQGVTVRQRLDGAPLIFLNGGSI